MPNRFEPNFSGHPGNDSVFPAGRQQERARHNSEQRGQERSTRGASDAGNESGRDNLRTTGLANWYDYGWHVLGSDSRLTNCYIDKEESGYSEVMDFQGAMQRARDPALLPPAGEHFRFAACGSSATVCGRKRWGRSISDREPAQLRARGSAEDYADHARGSRSTITGSPKS
jgi:hypothetical protein